MNLTVNEYPNVLEMEKKLISALMLKESKVVPKIAAILQLDDFYRLEHKLIYRAISTSTFRTLLLIFFL